MWQQQVLRGAPQSSGAGPLTDLQRFDGVGLATRLPEPPPPPPARTPTPPAGGTTLRLSRIGLPVCPHPPILPVPLCRP